MKKLPIRQNMIDEASEITAAGGDRKAIAKALGVSRATVSRWIANNEDFMNSHRLAKMEYAESLVESLMAEAKKPLPDDPKQANAEIQRRRLMADNIKWIACKLIPKTYGDKIDVTGEVSLVSPLAQLRALEVSTTTIAPIPPKKESAIECNLSENDCI